MQIQGGQTVAVALCRVQKGPRTPRLHPHPGSISAHQVAAVQSVTRINWWSHVQEKGQEEGSKQISRLAPRSSRDLRKISEQNNSQTAGKEKILGIPST